MKIRTIPQLIKQINKIGEQKIKQGVYFKELALSIEHHKSQKSFKEWFRFAQKILNLNKNEEMKGGYN